MADDISDLAVPMQSGPQQSQDISDLAEPTHPQLGFAGTAALTTLAGVGSLPRVATQGIDWLGRRAGVNIGADQALGSIPHPLNRNYPLFPTYQQYMGAAQDAGFSPSEPQTPFGRATQAAASTALLAAGDPAAIPGAMAGGFAGQYASEMAPEHPILARLAAFVPASWTVNRLGNNAGQLAAAVTPNRQMNPTAAAFQRQGMYQSGLTGDVTGAPGLRFAQTAARNMPGGEGTIEAAQEAALADFGAALDRNAQKLGPSVTAQDAGTALQGAAQNWLLKFKNNSNNLWNQFYSKVPSNTPVDVSNYRGALTSVLDDFGSASNSASVLQAPLARRLQDALGMDLGAGGTTLPWQSIKAIRSAIGAKIDSGQPVADIGQAELKRVYAGLTTDMQNAAGNVSPDALSAFHKANAYTAAGHDLLDNQLGGIIRAPNPESATQYVLAQKGIGGSRIGAATFNLPEAQGDLAAYQMRSMAGNVDNPSPTTFATQAAGRRPVLSPEARNILFGQPRTAQDIQDMTTIGRSMQRTEQSANSSRTAPTQERLGRFVAAWEMAKEGREGGGLPGALMGAGIGLLSPSAIGRGAAWAATSPMLKAIYSAQPYYTLHSPNLWTTRLPFALTPPQIGGPSGGQ